MLKQILQQTPQPYTPINILLFCRRNGRHGVHESIVIALFSDLIHALQRLFPLPLLHQLQMLIIELDGRARIFMTVMISFLYILVQHDLREILQRQFPIPPTVHSPFHAYGR